MQAAERMRDRPRKRWTDWRAKQSRSSTPSTDTTHDSSSTASSLTSAASRVAVERRAVWTPPSSLCCTRPPTLLTADGGRQKGKQRRKQGYASDELDEEEERKEGATDEQGRRRVQEMSSHNVFDPQTAHRQYERNLLHAQQQQRVHSHSEQSTASSSSSAADPYTARSAPSETAVDRLVADIDAATKRRAAFSRRRRFNEQEDVTYINERNRTFNKKVARAFDAFTIDIAQSLERGTAL